ncbi:MAG: haloacid dehalogenase [Epsilonproteobacteria bacterium (ex Lamellibrachia satsuma)]|nr:MAG: haloacid dehalogenase [Epsilonproteobacteria bacterium (ex Lamellibrachia satsuma)]
MTIEIPHYRTLELKHLVLDYNGTLAKDGTLIREAKPLLHALGEHYTIHVITSDTFGTVQAQLKGLDITVKVLHSDDHTAEKSDYIHLLGREHCIAIGNGSNDMMMLQNAVLGIALIGNEGCSTRTLKSSDIICTDIGDALELALSSKRMIATLRQ